MNRFDGADCATPEELNQLLWDLQNQVDELDPNSGGTETFDYTAGAALSRNPVDPGVYRFDVLYDGTTITLDGENRLVANVGGGGDPISYYAGTALSLSDTTFHVLYDSSTLAVNQDNQLTVIGGGGGGTGDGSTVLHGYLTADLLVTDSQATVHVTHATNASLAGTTIQCENPEDRLYNNAFPGSSYRLFCGNEYGHVRATLFQSTWRLDLVQTPYNRPAR